MLKLITKHTSDTEVISAIGRKFLGSKALDSIKFHHKSLDHLKWRPWRFRFSLRFRVHQHDEATDSRIRKRG
ncbi:hypothetical protein Taro_037166 [Colocasia esculenta]|uniref:Uncharacterized protein n=1 Tax=Colocasia esculenta TaxID=4460 RepID=A0A843WFH3_COLES|nr:hypothetical protein [Colocasia esculenta]